ncbi:MAG TPA: hypothetical protein VFW19_10835 [Allosphingosinicella sp.]|nr:hypothetical protein [Allosphingosinicella sp.]
MDIGEVIGGGFRILRDKPLAVVVWAIVYLAMFVVMGFLMRSMMAAQIQAMSDPQAIGSAMAALAGPFILFFLLSLIVYVVLFAAVQRAVLKPEQQGFFYLRLGMDEARLLALTILFLVVYYAAMVAMFVLVAMAGASGSGAAVAAMILLLFPAIIAFTAWYFVRFGLAFPLTMMREKIVIGEAWRITRGRFWPLFAASLVVFIIMIVLWMVVSSFTNAGYFQDLAAANGNPAAVQRAIQAQMERQFGLNAASIVIWATGAVVGAISITLWGGAAATAVRLLTFDPKKMADTFA